MLRILDSLSSLFLLVVLASSSSALAAAMSAEDAWKALPTYRYGSDMAALLTIDAEMIHAMATPEKRAACAARLAAILESKETTLAAKQYVCCQLRQVGTAAEVPRSCQDVDEFGYCRDGAMLAGIDPRRRIGCRFCGSGSAHCRADS